MAGDGASLVAEGERRPVLPNLTAVRIFAAVMVLLHHLYGRPWENRPWYDAWFDGGYQGVNLFFVLSGFLLAYQAADGPVELRRFYIRRMARVYPLYLAAMLWGLPNFLRHGPTTRWVEVPAGLLLMQSWFGRQFSMQWNSPAWSLSVEAFFYAVFPLLLPWARERMGHWRIWVWLVAALAMLPPLLVWAGRRRMEMGNVDWGGWIVCFPPLRVGEFLIGIFFGLQFARRRPRISGAGMAVAAGVVVALLGLHGSLAYEFERNGVLAIPFAVLLYSLAGWRSRWLASAPMQVLGEISYGVYLLQFPLLFTINSFVPNGLHSHALVGVLELMLILPTAFLFYVAVEKPGRRLVLAWLGVRSHSKPLETEQAGLV